LGGCGYRGIGGNKARQNTVRTTICIDGPRVNSNQTTTTRINQSIDQTHLEGIVGRKMNIEEKDPSRIRRILRTHNGGLPMEHIVTDGTGGTIGRWVLAQIDQFLKIMDNEYHFPNRAHNRMKKKTQREDCAKSAADPTRKTQKGGVRIHSSPRGHSRILHWNAFVSKGKEAGRKKASCGDLPRVDRQVTASSMLHS
jgi:hypothetical protein